MANTAQAKKRIRQSEKHRIRNIALRNKFRTYVKKVVKAIEAKDTSGAETAYKEAVPVIDQMVTKGIIHSNKAARHKSRLAAHLKKLSTQAA